MSRRDVHALRRMKTERTWKDEVQERVQKRRSDRAAGAEPLPLFPEETPELVEETDLAVSAPVTAPPPAPSVSRSGSTPALRGRAFSDVIEAPHSVARMNPGPPAASHELGEIDLRAPRTAPPAPGSPLDLPLQSDADVALEPVEGRVETAAVTEPEMPEAHVLLLDEPAAEAAPEPPAPRLDWGAAPSDGDWLAGREEDTEIPVVERPATPEERLNAALLDAAVIVSFWTAAVYLASRAAQVDALGLVPAWPGLLAFLALLGLVYAAWFTGSTGQTPGKMLVGVRVVDRSGAPLGVARALARAVLGAFGTALVGAGLWPMLFDPARRALHDRAVQARVIRG
ncbi:MAG: RDD family protein [Vicinamibacteria bacterium]|jgi:uncharacterized RDD family membrane protein YckC|nr:RDD family protein [Vicinamibacteria bacterium]